MGEISVERQHLTGCWPTARAGTEPTGSTYV